MRQTRPDLSGRPVALFVFSNLREQKGGLTKAWLRRLALFHEAGWDTHVATIHPQPEIDRTLAAWRERGWLPDGTEVHHYQRRTRRLRPAWTRKTDATFTRDDRIADWLDWLVGRIPGAVVFADSPVTYAPVARMRNPFVGRIMTVHLAHRPGAPDPGAGAAGERQLAPARSIYQGEPGAPKLAARFLPFADSADAVVALTHRQAEHLVEDVPGIEVHVIPNILDTAQLPEPERRDPMLVVQLGRLDPFKRIDHALRAVALARRELPELHLAVHGRGPDLERLVALRDELGLGDAVTFAGFTDDPLRVLSRASASLMTSRREGFGLAVAESLAVGTPVVSYEIDYGPAELVEDGVNGRLVPDGSVEALAAALVELLSDSRAWRRMSDNAPASVSALRPEVVARQWLDLAEDVAGRVAVPPTALLVEDLRVRRDGVHVAGVAVGRERRTRPGHVRVEACAAVPLAESDDPRAGGSDLARDVTATLTWADVAAWPVGAALQASDPSGRPVPVLAPGLPATVLPTAERLVVVRPDAQGAPGRSATDRARFELDPERARARVGQDVTIVTDAIRLAGRLVGGRGRPVRVELMSPTPGVELEAGSTLALLGRSDQGQVRIGTLHLLPGRAAGGWPWSADLDWDEAVLERLRDSSSVIVSLGIGPTHRRIGDITFAAERPVALHAGQRWLLAPATSGLVVLIPGRGARARALWAVRRLRPGRARP